MQLSHCIQDLPLLLVWFKLVCNHLHLHLRPSPNCHKSFFFQVRSSLVPAYSFFRRKNVHKTSFKDEATLFLERFQCFKAVFLSKNELRSFKVHNISSEMCVILSWGAVISFLRHLLHQRQQSINAEIIRISSSDNQRNTNIPNSPRE